MLDLKWPATTDIGSIANFAARLITGAARHDHITPILHRLHWIPISSRIKFKILLLTYKCVLGLAPSYLQEIMAPYEPRWSLCSEDKLMLKQANKVEQLPLETGVFFIYAAPPLWNNLPQDVRESGTVPVFK